MKTVLSTRRRSQRKREPVDAFPRAPGARSFVTARTVFREVLLLCGSGGLVHFCAAQLDGAPW